MGFRERRKEKRAIAEALESERASPLSIDNAYKKSLCALRAFSVNSAVDRCHIDTYFFDDQRFIVLTTENTDRHGVHEGSRHDPNSQRIISWVKFRNLNDEFLRSRNSGSLASGKYYFRQ
jgi:hypothetical protein